MTTTEPDEIKISKPEVEITRMKLETVKELADSKNDIFSELSGMEIDAVATAFLFANDPTPNINKKLVELGIEPIRLSLLEKYCIEFIKQRQKKGRARVREYIDALDKITPKTGVGVASDLPQRGILGRGGRLI